MIARRILGFAKRLSWSHSGEFNVPPRGRVRRNAGTYYRWPKEYGGLMVDQVLRRMKDLEKENARLRRGGVGPHAGQADPSGGCQGKLLSPARRRRCIEKRVERIWRREGLKVPQKQPKRGRLWLNDGSCIRLRPEYPGHVWAYDFVEVRTHDGCKFRILTIIDEASRECLALIVARQLICITANRDS